ncbi:MAG: hypothetical protein M1822_008961 [Bathelium mastoideum]|nr:MAG: hypothetical protein M1822_008961 [Bathelium mastoideum]
MDKETDSAAAAVEKACAILRQEAASYAANEQQQGKEQTLRLKDLAGKVSLTNSYFHKIFRQRTGVTPKKYLDSLLSHKSNNAAQVSHQSTSPSNAGVGSQYTTAIDTSSITASALDHIPALGFGPNKLETTSADTHNHLSALDFASVINDKDMDTTHAPMPQRIFEPDQSIADGDADWSVFNDGFIPGEWTQTAKAAANPVFNMDDLYSTTFDMGGQFFVGDGMPWDDNMSLALDNLQELPSPLIEHRSY